MTPLEVHQPNSQSTFDHMSVNESVRHHFRNYLWLNNKQVLKALVSSSSPGFFSAQLHFALKAQLAKKKKKKNLPEAGKERGGRFERFRKPRKGKMRTQWSGSVKESSRSCQRPLI